MNTVTYNRLYAFPALIILCLFLKPLTTVAQPAIRSFTPTTTSPGTNIVITGIRFTGTTSVRIGGRLAASYAINSDTQITVTVGCDNLSGEVSVTAPAGTGALAGFTFVPASLLITGFSPSSGLPGTIVTMTGRGMHCVTRVTVGGVAATEVFAVLGDQSSMSFRVPNGAATGVITLTSSAGSANASEQFTVLTPAPTISGFSPSSGAPGTVITITGTNLSGATQVSVGGVQATTFSVNRDGSLLVTVPSAATSGGIRVTTPGGTVSSGSSFAVILPVPVIRTFTPANGSAGTQITISGANFTGVTAVRFGTINATSFSVISSTQITAVVPSGAGTVLVSVVTAGGTATSASSFTIDAATPSAAITSFSPTSGPRGTIVTVTGSGFTGVVSANFQGATIPVTVSANGMSASFTVPQTASGVAGFSLNLPNGLLAVAPMAFNVIVPPVSLAPTITNFNPSSGAPGNIITITGTNFTGTSLVAIGGRTAPFTVASPTTIIVTIPTGVSGNSLITVITPNGQVTSSAGVQVITSVRIALEYAMRIFPQPATGSATLEYSLSEASLVQVEIVNSLGASVVKYDTKQQTSGLQRIMLVTETLVHGLYFVRVNIGGKQATVPLQVVR